MSERPGLHAGRWNGLLGPLHKRVLRSSAIFNFVSAVSNGLTVPQPATADPTGSALLCAGRAPIGRRTGGEAGEDEEHAMVALSHGRRLLQPARWGVGR